MITAIKYCVVERLVGMTTKMPDIAHRIRATRLLIWNVTVILKPKIKKTCIKFFLQFFGRINLTDIKIKGSNIMVTFHLIL